MARSGYNNDWGRLQETGQPYYNATGLSSIKAVPVTILDTNGDGTLTVADSSGGSYTLADTDTIDWIDVGT